MPTPCSDPRCQARLTRPHELIAGLRTARAGDRVVYHEGFLAVDRGSAPVPKGHEHRRVDALAAAVLTTAAAGRVHLVQRRLATGAFAYLAVKAHPRPERGGHPGQLRRRQAIQAPEQAGSPSRPGPTLRRADRYVTGMKHTIDLEPRDGRASDAGDRPSQVEGAGR